MNKSSTASEVIRIEEVEARFALVVRRKVTFAEMGDAQRHARALLAAALRSAGAAPGGLNLTIWRPLPDGLVDYAPGVFVDAAFAADGETGMFELPAGHATRLTVTGSYADLPAAWQRLRAEAEVRGSAGLNWEVYTRSGSGPDDNETDLFALLA